MNGTMSRAGFRQRLPVCAALFGFGLILTSPSGRCDEPIVACCRPDANCDTALHTNCADLDGDPQPPGVTCGGVTCATLAWAQAPVYAAPTSECLESWGAETLIGGSAVAADNFSLTAQTSVSAVHWWGMHLGWSSPTPPVNDSEWFHVGVWSNVPAGTGEPAEPWDRPGTLLWQSAARREDLSETFVGCSPNVHPGPDNSAVFRYELPIPVEERFQTASAGSFWLSIAASQVNPACECQGDVTIPSGSPNQGDVTFVSTRLGCPVGTGDTECDRCDLNCDGQVLPGDVSIAQCQVISGWADPSCCASTAAHSWRWIARPRELGPGAVRMTSPTVLDIGSAYTAGERLVDIEDSAWDLAFVLTGSTGSVFVPDPPQADLNGVDKNRYVTIVPPATWAGHEIALRVRLTALDRFATFDGQTRWGGVPGPFLDGAAGTFHAAPLGCTPDFRDWNSIMVIHLYGAAVVPSSIYEIQAVDRSCEGSLGDENCFSASLVVHTAKWGDVTEPFGGVSQPNFGDISSMVDKFKSLPSAIPKVQAQLRPNVVVPALSLSFLDVSVVVEAFQGRFYPFAGPDVCP